MRPPSHDCTFGSNSRFVFNICYITLTYLSRLKTLWFDLPCCPFLGSSGVRRDRKNPDISVVRQLCRRSQRSYRTQSAL